MMDAVMDAAQMCSAAVWVNPTVDARPPSVDGSGSCALVDTGARKLLITADHVLAELYEKRKGNPEAVLCVCLGSFSISLTEPVVLDRDERVLDLAVIDFPQLDSVRGHQKRYFPIRQWPIPVAERSEAVTLVGFPGALRFAHRDFGAFEPAGLGFTVTSVSDRSIVLADESGTRKTEGLRFREDEDIPLGGFSGTPGFVLRGDMFHLIGFLRGGSKRLAGEPAMTLPGVAFLSPATYLQPGGTFDRHRMPYCP